MSKEKPAAVYMNIDDLYPAPDNPRVNDHVVDKVVRSIQLHGFAAPIVSNLEGEIIAGHTRWKAAKKLNMLTVPVRQINLTGDQARLYRIADNKLSEFADWDEDMLKEQLANLEKSFPVDVADLFTDDELEFFLKETEGWDDEFPDEIEKEVADMKEKSRIGLLFDFLIDDYKKILPIQKELREKDIYLGEIILEALRAANENN